MEIQVLWQALQKSVINLLMRPQIFLCDKWILNNNSDDQTLIKKHSRRLVIKNSKQLQWTDMGETPLNLVDVLER